RFILSFLPVNEQWNYTVGAVYKHYRQRGYGTWVVSRNYLKNISYKYFDNDEDMPKTYDYSSSEIENKFRYEHVSEILGGYKFLYGAGFEYAKYYNETFNLIYLENELREIEYSSFIDMFHYYVFGQASKAYFDKRWTLSFGFRVDGSSYSEEMQNPLKQFSPRFSSSYLITPRFAWNINLGRYYQRPPYTSMGYKNSQGEYVNKINGLKYIVSDHLISGFEFRSDDKSQIAIEGFYKWYSDYPFSVSDSVPLATKGADYGIFGDEELIPIASGRAYGFELLGRWQDLLGFNTIVSYTYVRSEFKDYRPTLQDNYLPTSWDNRHLLNITATKTFKRSWYFGVKWRFVGGAPYTPYDEEKSSIREAWDAQGGPYPDYSNYNELRLDAFHQLDIRVDKQYFFNKWSINFYVDIQNVYNFKGDEPDMLVRKSFVDPSYDDVFVDENGVERYELERITSEGRGTILPTVGVIIEF
ncbi:MAG: TonB-dependent receptor, partial [Bacteroidales bacterium]